jgi:GNAT superfamily N-acetyltransferase
VEAKVTIRPFAEQHAAQVRELFITVNRLLSPPELRDAFEGYIDRALAEEIDRISAYYGERDGCFWVAVKGDKVVGTFGLERASDDAMELRRMYVDPSARRGGSLGRCFNSRKTNAAVETSHGFSLALLKYSRPRSRYTEMRDIDWFMKRLSRR